MSAFWSHWVMVLVVLNLGVTLSLFLWGPWTKIPTLPDGTTGHTWAHGVLREGVRRLPTWWLLLSAAMFAGAIGYLVLYPGFGASQGTLSWTSSDEWAGDRTRNDARLATLRARLASGSVESLASDPDVQKLGRRLFEDDCAACHGREGRGNPALGAPDLRDGDWLYGGDGAALEATILDGRHGAMPPWGPVIGEAGVREVAEYVLSLSGAPHDAALAQAGSARFALCAGCHGADGKGSTAVGAPNLTDRIWLYGGDRTTVRASVRDGRGGTMPAWRERLGPLNARAVASYVYARAHDAGTAH